MQRGSGMARISSICSSALVVLVLICWCVESGLLQLPLPYPADHHHVAPWPAAAPFTAAPPPQMPPVVLPLHKLAVRMFEGELHNVETITGDPATGKLLLPDKWGAVHTALLQPDGSYRLASQPVAHVGPGRVLGSKLDTEGRLVMCDVLKGLVRLNTTSKQLQLLASRVTDDDSAIAYANGLHIISNGSIFFTASTDILPAAARGGSADTGFAWALSNLRGLPRGRVLVWHPHTGTTHVVASGFHYADGIAVSEDGSFLLVAETDALRVIKLWLTSNKAGQREVLLQSLPGLPAGLSPSTDGNYWLSMTVPVPPVTRYLRPILLRAVVAWMPRSWRPAVRVWGAVMKVSPEGQVLQVLLDPTGERVATASAATEFNGRLFLGSLLGGPFISAVDLSEADRLEKQLLLQRQRAEAAAPAESAAAHRLLGSVDWSAVGGKSLHRQQDL